MSDNKPKRNQLTSESEFVSDAFQTTNESDLEEIKDGMRKLGIDSMTQQQPNAALSNNDGKNSFFVFYSLYFLYFTLYFKLIFKFYFRARKGRSRLQGRFRN